MKLKYDDKRHLYTLDGRYCTGATSVASYPEDKYLINLWRCRMALTGGAQKPPLMERVAAHIDDRDKLNDLVEEAVGVAQANEARDRGTAIHRLAERIDLGEQIVDTPLARAVQDTWKAALDDAALTIDTGYVERIVIYPDLLIAGTFDRIVACWEDGQLYIADIKTGPNAVAYPHSTAIQLAIYANAPLLAGPIPKGGGTTQDFEPMPEVNKQWGYIIHMPEEAKADIVPIDIAAGWEAFNELCLPIQKWRRRKDLIQQRISAATWAPKPRLVPSTTADLEARTNWVKAWIGKIADQGSIEVLARRWPQGVPTTKQGGWTDSDIERIAQVCAEIDADDGISFHDPDPTITPTTQRARSKQHEPIS